MKKEVNRQVSIGDFQISQYRVFTSKIIIVKMTSTEIVNVRKKPYSYKQLELSF